MGGIGDLGYFGDAIKPYWRHFFKQEINANRRISGIYGDLNARPVFDCLSVAPVEVKVIDDSASGCGPFNPMFLCGICGWNTTNLPGSWG